MTTNIKKMVKDSDNQMMYWSFRYSNKKRDMLPLKDSLLDSVRHLADKYIFQLEDTGDNEHFQGQMKMKDKKRKSYLIRHFNELEFKGIEISICSNAGKLALANYCMKNDTRIAGPWADTPIYLGKDLPIKLFEWQQELLDIYNTDPDDRKILWIFNEQGNAGKTKFCKYMSFYYEAIKLGYGNAGDLLNLISKVGYKKLINVDLTRSRPKDFHSGDIYSAIESLKDGHFINTKYETKEVIMDIPHVFVFCNQLPDWECISMDRWDVRVLEDGRLRRFAGTQDDNSSCSKTIISSGSFGSQSVFVGDLLP